MREIARIHGFDHLPVMALPRTHVVSQPAVNPAQLRPLQLRRALAECGLMEAVTFSFLAPKEAALFGGGAAALTLVNTISADLSVMRPSALPNLLQAAGRNQDRGEADCALFEIGPVFLGDEPTEQRAACAGIRHGHTAPREWHHERRIVDVFDAKKDTIQTLLEAGYDRQNLFVREKSPSYYHPGKSGSVYLDKDDIDPVAYFGEIHPNIIKKLDIKTEALVGFEIYLEPPGVAGARRN